MRVTRNKIRTLAWCSVLLIGCLSLQILGVGLDTANAATFSPSNPGSFSYVVNIWMENQNYGSVIGSSSAPYETQLANTYSTDTSYHNLGASCGCSLPEYMGFFAGQYPSCASNDGSPGGCTDSSKNLVDILETGGVSWIAYAENYPVASGCFTQSNPGNGGFYDRHFMFNYYSDIVNNPSRCAKLFNSGGSAGSSSDSAFLASLNQASGWPNFIWLSPNGCNQTHDCGVSTGDSYLAGLVPQILSSNLFKTGKAALVITWDDNGSPPNIQVGPVVKQHYVSTVTYNHYSWLKTLEWNWGLPTIASGDAGASPMTDIFTLAGPTPLTASFNFSPTTVNPGTSVTFTATASGGTAPYSYTWNFGDGSTGTGQTPTHSYSALGTYTVSLTVQDSASPPASYSAPSKTVSVTTPGNPSITFVSSPMSPQVNQAVTFASTVVGGQAPYTYSWTFGDGSTSTAASPSHTYTTANTYTVGVTVTDSLSHTGTASASVTVINPPPGGTGTFIPSQWTLLGTGGSINSNGVFHINFNNPGGSWGFTGAACAGCPFESQIPVSSSSFINKQYLHLSGKVISSSSLGQAMYVETSIYYQFDQTGLSVPLLDTETQAVHWENGAYAPTGYSYVGSGSDSTHGTYSAWREVTVETGATGTFDYTIDMYALFNRGVTGLGLPAGTTGHLVRIEPGVEGIGVVSVDYYTADMSGTWPAGGTPVPDFSLVSSPPSISIPAGSSGYATLTMTSLNGYTDTLTLSTSTPGTGISPSMSPASLSLASGGQSTSTLTISTTTAATAGTYSLVVTVTGTGLSHQVTVQVSVTAPSVQPLSGSFTLSPTAGQVNQTISFSATAVNGVQPYSFMWDFGDGNAASGTTVSHAYTMSGNYTVTLIVTDAASVTASVQKILSITSTITSLLSLTVPGSQSASTGSLLTFTITAYSQAAQGEITLFANNLPPGATFTSTPGNPATGTFSWRPDQSAKSGSYSVTFNAVQAGSTHEASKTVTIAFAAAPGNPCVLVCGLSPVISSTISLVTIGAIIGVLTSVVLVKLAAYRKRRDKNLPPVSIPLASVSSMPSRVDVTPIYGAMRKPFGAGSRIPELHRPRHIVRDGHGSEADGVQNRTHHVRNRRSQR